MTDVRYMSTENAFDSFTMKMRNVLEENETKKGNSWASCDLQFLLDKLDEEIKEFKEANRPMAKAEEIVDVANICMMLYHRYVEIWAEKTAEFLNKPVVEDKMKKQKREICVGKGTLIEYCKECPHLLSGVCDGTPEPF